MPITESEIHETQLVTAEQWHELAERSLALFARGQELAAEKGLILVDTKYEFGLDEDGMIVVADEIHTPDSSRFWIADTYQDRFDAGEEPDSLDKEFLRLWIVSQCNPYHDPIPDIPAETLIEFSNKYVALFERARLSSQEVSAGGSPYSSLAVTTCAAASARSLVSSNTQSRSSDPLGVLGADRIGSKRLGGGLERRVPQRIRGLQEPVGPGR